MLKGAVAIAGFVATTAFEFPNFVAMNWSRRLVVEFATFDFVWLAAGKKHWMDPMKKEWLEVVEFEHLIRTSWTAPHCHANHELVKFAAS